MNYRRWRRFSKGVVNTDDIGIGEEASGTLRYARNVRVRSGDVVARPGSVEYKDLSIAVQIAGKDVVTLNEYNREYDTVGGEQEFWNVLIFTTSDNRLWYYDPDADVIVEIDNTFTLTNNDIYGINVYDYFIFGTPDDGVKMTDGNNIYNLGIAAPTDVPVITVNNAGGAAPKSRAYRITYYYDGDPFDIESDYGSTVTASNIDSTNVNNTIDVTAAKAAASGVDSRINYIYIYMTDLYDPSTEAQPTTYYLIGTIAIGGVPVSVTDAQENVLGLAAADTTDRGLPPDCHKFLWHDARLFMIGEQANPSVIYYSAPGRPWYFPANNWDEVAREDGDILTAIGSIGPTRYLFKQRSIYEWTGDPESVTPIRAVERPDSTMNMNKVGVGCYDPRSLVGWRDSLIFRAQDGHVYKLSQTALIRLSEYYRDVADLSSASVAAVHNDYYIITNSGTTHVCDLRNGAWQGQDIGLNGAVLCVDHNGYLLAGKDDAIKRWYTGTQDEGEDFDKAFQPNYQEVSDGLNEAVVRRVLAECSTRDCDLSVYVYNEAEAISTGTLATTDRHYSLADGSRGKVADYLSVRFEWSGTARFQGVRAFFLPRKRRH